MLDVIQRWNCKAALILRIDTKIDVSQMAEVPVNRIGPYVFSRNLVLGSNKAPTLKLSDVLAPVARSNRGIFTHLQHLPVDCSVGNDVFQTFELPSYKGSMGFMDFSG